MNQTTTSLLRKLQSLKNRTSLRTRIIIIAVLLVTFATAIALMVRPSPAQPEVRPPSYVQPETWVTVTLPTGNDTTVRMSMPQPPKLVSTDETTGNRHYCYANQHLILVCATAPLATPLNLPTTAAQPQNSKDSLISQALAGLRNLTREAMQRELSSANLKGQPLTLVGDLNYTPCIYRDSHADFFTGKATTTPDGQEEPLDITGRIFYRQDAMVYAYAYSNSQLGKKLADRILDSIAFLNASERK